MSVTALIVIILLLSATGFFWGRQRARRSVDGIEVNLHSRANYYGWNVALLTSIPAMIVLLLSLFVQPIVVNTTIASEMTAEDIPEGKTEGLVLDQVRSIALGLDVAIAQNTITETEAQNIGKVEDPTATLKDIGITLASDVTPRQLDLAQDYRELNQTTSFWRGMIIIAIAIGGFALGLRRAYGEYRARNSVERVIRGLLFASASIAILTTFGIVYSMLSESIRFFSLYSPVDFFFGLTWSPSFGGGENSELGFLPVLWGTLYISLVALIVAVPVGLFVAIYLSEYAGSKLRAFAKPAIEVLAGIPTIVYGLFALTTFGPWLLNWFGQDGFGWMNDARSVLTAGIVMGILLIPFISSLSDDIIGSVPRTLRDASLGLGSTQSETVRLVVLPAALPGIVGAILLAASRAIGETMIVVLGAGAIARISGNPFEAMTTITTRIVAQLTGDGDFESAETLVAFSLGLTLFVMTLAMNVYALYIVRKYQEQYE